MKRFIYIVILVVLGSYNLLAQVADEKPLIPVTDSTTSRRNPALTRDTIITIRGKDTMKVVPAHSPRKATFRSAVLPGWGQAYNKQYWKIPLVYAAIGVPAGFFIYNNTWYQRSKFAYEIKVDPANQSRIDEIHPDLRRFSAADIRFYRNEFRRNRDYSLLFFLLAWGLNVVDATVFAHLKEFDVSNDLSLQLQPKFDQRSNGISLVLAPKIGAKPRLLTSR